MSDGLNRVLGTDTTIELNGKKYKATRLRYKHIAEASQHVLDIRPDLIEEVGKSLAKVPEQFHQAIIDAAVRRMEQRTQVEEAELRRFMGSMEGQHFVLWMMLRDNNPQFDSPAKVQAEFDDLDLEELARKIKEKSGLDDLKNSDGREAEAGDPATTDDPHERRGQSSISV